MPTYEEIFDYADGYYQRLLAFIEEAVAYAGSLGFAFDLDQLIKDADVALAYGLLQVAGLDRHFHYREIEFIMNLFTHEDLMEYVSSLLEETLTWDDVYQRDVEGMVDIIDDIEEDITVRMRPMVKLFAIAFASGKDSLSIDALSQCSAHISASMVHIDKDPSEDVEAINMTFFLRLENTAYLFVDSFARGELLPGYEDDPIALDLYGAVATSFEHSSLPKAKKRR